MTRRFASSIRVMKHLNTSFLFLLPEKLKSEVAVINIRQLRCRDEVGLPKRFYKYLYTILFFNYGRKN